MRKSRLLGAGLACALTATSFLTHAAMFELEGRLEQNAGTGDFLAYYDKNLGITWTANANINGAQTWDDQVTWAAGFVLNDAVDWRLPSADKNGINGIVNCAGGGVIGCNDNEMGFLYWDESITSANTKLPFNNLQFDKRYWSGTESTNILGDPYTMDFDVLGTNFVHLKTEKLYAFAVHDGDIFASTVPVPAAAWLFVSGLLGLAGVAKCKKT